MAQRERYFADIFDADGKFYVLDEHDQCSECAGPFDTLTAAREKADEMNAAMPDSEALDIIATMMSGNEWDADLLENLASTVRATNRTIEDVN